MFMTKKFQAQATEIIGQGIHYNDTQHNNTKHNSKNVTLSKINFNAYAQCSCIERRILIVTQLSRIRK
jgi:hypothetical protein